MTVQVRFWGVRGSLPTPGPSTLRYGGNTACLQLLFERDDGSVRSVLVDAGSGLAAYSRSLSPGPVTTDLFLTHAHLDHVQGLPFFAAAYDPNSHVALWHLAEHDPLPHLMVMPLSPVPLAALRGIGAQHVISAGDQVAFDDTIHITTGRLNHPGGSMGYRFEHRGKVVALLFDHEHGDAACDATALALAKGADLVVYDATYDDASYEAHRGWGHSTWQHGCDLASAAGARKLALFHHEPTNDDARMDAIATAARARFPGAFVAAEGPAQNY